MRTFPIWIAIGALLSVAAAAEKKLQLKDLPPAVQKTVQDQTKGAEIRGISSETEKGKLTYEIETMVNGKHRDFRSEGPAAGGAKDRSGSNQGRRDPRHLERNREGQAHLRNRNHGQRQTPRL